MDETAGAAPGFTELPRWGVRTAPGFPAAEFDAMEPVTHALAEIPRGFLLRAWVAVAFRHRTCYLDSIALPDALAAIANDAYYFERALFSFFTAGLSALESAAFGIHAIGHASLPKQFPMTSADEQKRVTIASTHKLMARHFASQPVTGTLGDLLADGTYLEWCDIRNFVAHRATPGRNITVVVGGSTWTTWGRFGTLEPSFTASRLTWLEGRLSRLLSEAESFGRSIGAAAPSL